MNTDIKSYIKHFKCFTIVKKRRRENSYIMDKKIFR